MKKVLNSLRGDHTRMSGILDGLDQQLARIDSGGAVDRQMLGDAVEYCQAYPARVHHQKEDLVMRRLRARDEAAAAAAGDLEAEHARLLRLTNSFTAAGRQAIEESDSASGEFAQITREFINAYRAHIEREERYFLPAALWSLTPEDWVEIEREIAKLSPPPAPA